MINAIWDRLRGARRFSVYAGVMLFAVLALLWTGTGDNRRAEPSKSDLERRVERILSRIDGVEGAAVMINQQADGTVVGAVVVVDGLRDVGTYLKLQSAVGALLDVQIDRIRIIGNDDVFEGGTG